MFTFIRLIVSTFSCKCLHFGLHPSTVSVTVLFPASKWRRLQNTSQGLDYLRVPICYVMVGCPKWIFKNDQQSRPIISTALDYVKISPAAKVVPLLYGPKTYGDTLTKHIIDIILFLSASIIRECMYTFAFQIFNNAIATPSIP